LIQGIDYFKAMNLLRQRCFQGVGADTQNHADVDGLPDEWKRLEQVRHELEGWKEELRVNAHKRLEREVGDSLPPLTSGQVVEQKLFYIYVDRPVVKERITNKLQRTFYEREYVKMVSHRNLLNLKVCLTCTPAVLKVQVMSMT
jgi:hypothetical protein